MSLISDLLVLGIEIPCKSDKGPCGDCLQLFDYCSSLINVLHQWKKLKTVYSESECFSGRKFLDLVKRSFVELSVMLGLADGSHA